NHIIKDFPIYQTLIDKFINPIQRKQYPHRYNENFRFSISKILNKDHLYEEFKEYQLYFVFNNNLNIQFFHNIINEYYTRIQLNPTLNNPFNENINYFIQNNKIYFNNLNTLILYISIHSIDTDILEIGFIDIIINDLCEYKLTHKFNLFNKFIIRDLYYYAIMNNLCNNSNDLETKCNNIIK
ncbi:MAG: hypothetical protein KIT69_18095, partial [Propionibacteriaceae bacterium]|nr:hypothetical protein [Propionibacteriaceae bacterium]